MPTENRVSIAVSDGVADVRFNRADKMNALDRAQFEAISEAAATLMKTKGVRCAVLSGEGRAFCAGIDLSTLDSDPLPLEPRTHGAANLFQDAAMAWRNVPVPVIAAVHGVAFGGGFQIMLGADIRIVAPDARLSVMEVKWGLAPDMAGIALMRHLAGDDVVRELTYTAREFSGEEALRLGFATRVSAAPYDDAMALAREIASRSPHAVRASKRLLNQSRDADLAAILLAESREASALIKSRNQMETLKAAREKRAPIFDEAE